MALKTLGFLNHKDPHGRSLTIIGKLKAWSLTDLENGVGAYKLMDKAIDYGFSIYNIVTDLENGVGVSKLVDKVIDCNIMFSSYFVQNG